MKSKIKWAVVAVLVIVAACSYVALNTRFGVHLMLDVLSEIGSPPEVQTTADQGSLRLSATLEPVERIPLPASIQQPSGIKHRNGAVYISTDQTEIFKLDTDLQRASRRVYLLGGPLLFKQGSLEGIEVHGDELMGIGEFGALRVWTKQGESDWSRAPDASLPAPIAAEEFSGIVDTPTGRFATSENHRAIFDLGAGTSRPIDFGDFLKDGADPAALAFSGIAYADGRFFVLSESHTLVLVVDEASARVEHVFGIEPSAAADLSVHQGKCYVVIDHNHDQPVEPVPVYDLQAAMTALEEQGGAG